MIRSKKKILWGFIEENIFWYENKNWVEVIQKKSNIFKWLNTYCVHGAEGCVEKEEKFDFRINVRGSLLLQI